MIRYTPAFQENVAGTLRARFRLDGNGNPVSGVEDETTFYFIELSLDSPNARQIHKVAYLLDQATYWEPERESNDWQHAFTEEITSYGDFLVRVEVKMPTGRFVQQALLSDMLEAGHENDLNPQIAQAIAYIRNN